MQRPADAASRLFMATGLGLILAAAFGLQQQMLDFDNIGLGWIIGISGLLLVGLSILVAKGEGPFAKAYPLEDDLEMANRVNGAHRCIHQMIAHRQQYEAVVMSEVPENMYYTKEHEWIRVEGDEIVIGITDHAQNALTDIVYVELPDVGEELGDMEEFAIVESVKSASPIFAPLAGKVTAVNEELDDTPELLNEEPYGTGWIIRMRLSNPEAVSTLMDAAAYKAEIGE